MSKQPVPNISKDSVSDEELAVYRLLKPYIGHCLTMNHDLNNPLSGIIGYAEFLMQEGDYLSEEHRAFVQQILQSAERIQKIVEDLCVDKIELMEKIDLQELIEAYRKVARSLD